ncbi:alpha/beta hydrolase [Aspergillus homomorphus CBS 101889]|uniref:Alpha/beta hydrolase fold-3 domain-containing protein n=1 Tax=Aspergillus homomorphus (strain CBS 101889) TaxID=1450537 RepID=A0A395IHC0_ASPHC|nr:hypothetical protein BO97DRAFT_448039 [Aspergillus homomorphus CBS 101889]RAL17604.1 hypothetical protein BO97DRAFT_448039 [Aspergillus homomorphus CBS 101889]
MFHGGGFVLDHAAMNHWDQINDCLERGWIVLSLAYRLCPGVNVLQGPMADARATLQWVQEGGLASALYAHRTLSQPNYNQGIARGTSSGGHLALSLVLPRPPLAVLDFYGAKECTDDFWHQPIEKVRSQLDQAPALDKPILGPLFQVKTTLRGGMSLEGQSAAPGDSPSASDAWRPFALRSIAEGRVLEKTRLRVSGIQTRLILVPGKHHTFVGQMKKESATWWRQRERFDFLQEVLDSAYYV